MRRPRACSRTSTCSAVKHEVMPEWTSVHLQRPRLTWKATSTTSPRTIDAALRPGERSRDVVRRERDRFRPPEPRQGAAARKRRRSATCRDAADPRRASRRAFAVVVGRPARRRDGRRDAVAVVARCVTAAGRRSAPAAADDGRVDARPLRTTLPPSEAIVDRILDAAAGLDLVGIYAAGPV